MEITINNHTITITQEPQTQYYAPITKEMILEYLKELKSALEKDGVTKLRLFGSYANGYAKNISSDIDIVVEMNDEFHKKFLGCQYFAYIGNIRENIEKHFHRNVDICDAKYYRRKTNKEVFLEVLFMCKKEEKERLL